MNGESLGEVLLSCIIKIEMKMYIVLLFYFYICILLIFFRTQQGLLLAQVVKWRAFSLWTVVWWHLYRVTVDTSPCLFLAHDYKKIFLSINSYLRCLIGLSWVQHQNRPIRSMISEFELGEKFYNLGPLFTSGFLTLFHNLLHNLSFDNKSNSLRTNIDILPSINSRRVIPMIFFQYIQILC